MEQEVQLPAAITARIAKFKVADLRDNNLLPVQAQEEVLGYLPQTLQRFYHGIERRVVNVMAYGAMEYQANSDVERRRLRKSMLKLVRQALKEIDLFMGEITRRLALPDVESCRGFGLRRGWRIVRLAPMSMSQASIVLGTLQLQRPLTTEECILVRHPAIMSLFGREVGYLVSLVQTEGVLGLCWDPPRASANKRRRRKVAAPSDEKLARVNARRAAWSGLTDAQRNLLKRIRATEKAAGTKLTTVPEFLAAYH